MAASTKDARRNRLAGAVLLLMTAALMVYITLHSPAREVLGRVISVQSRRLYFAASPPLSDIASAFGPITTVVCAAWAAALTVRRIPGASYERPMLFAILALACTTVPAAIVGVLSWIVNVPLLKAPLGPLVCSLPVVGFALWVRNRYTPQPQRIDLAWASKLNWVDALLAGIALTLFGFVIVAAVLHPPSGYDALSFRAPLGILFWREGNVASFIEQNREYISLAHPGTAELLYGLFGLIGGEPLANLGQLPFALLGAAAAFAFARRLGTSGRGGWIAGLAFLTAPMVVMQSGTQLNDLAGASLFMSAVALASAPDFLRCRSRIALIGIALGLAITTKLLLIPAVGFLLLFLFFRSWRESGRAMQFQRLAVGVVAMVAVATPWWLRNTVLYANPVYPAAIPFIGTGLLPSHFWPKDREFVPARIAWPAYPLVESHSDLSGFGPLLAVLALPGMVIRLRGRRPALKLYVALAIFALPAWWVTTAHEPRLLLYLAGLTFSFLPFTLAIFRGRLRTVSRVLLVVTALFSAAVTLDQALLPFVREPLERSTYFNVSWGVDPAVFALGDKPLVVQNGFAPGSYTAYYALMGARLNRRVIALDTDATPADIATRMRTSGAMNLYLAINPEQQPRITSDYGAYFQLEHSSIAPPGRFGGAVRMLFKLN
jgi:hypothetical protein